VLVLSDNYYPGWQARVDGAQVEIYRANCTMRAVTIPAGRHMVSFVFMPSTLKFSALFSLAATVCLLAFFAVVSVRRKRNPVGEE
jgi:uncharacterized membrane protein YfhO